MQMGAEYKANPHEDDFMNECLDLLKDSPNNGNDLGDEEFWLA